MNLRAKLWFTRIPVLFVLLWVTVTAGLGLDAFALNQDSVTGNKPFHYTGYRVIDSRNVQVWFDKGLPSSNVTKEQFRLYEGADSNGAVLSLEKVAQPAAYAKNIPADLALPSGSSYVLTVNQGNPLQAGRTYTVKISTSLRANNGVTIGAFRNNRDIEFSFVVPDSGGAYPASAASKVNFWVEPDATQVPVEGNLWFSVDMPVVNYTEVLAGMVLKENGAVLPYDPVIDSQPVAGARSYSPVVNNDHTYFFIPLVGGGGTSNYNLALDTQYSLEIPAMQLANGTTVPGRTLSFRTGQTDVPSTLTSTPAANTGNGELQLSWSPLPNTTGYNVYYSDNADWGYSILPTSPISGTSCTVSGLTGGKTYYFRVAGMTAGGEGGLSPSVTATTLPDGTGGAAGTAPHWEGGVLGASNLSANGVRLSWSGAVDDVGVTAYRIYENGTLINPQTVTATVYSVSGLAPSTAYLFKVTAVDPEGQESADGPETSVTTLPESGTGTGAGNGTGTDAGGGSPPVGGAADTVPPSFPAGSTLKAVKTAQMEADITWTAASDNAGVAGYRIFIDGGSTPAYSVGNVTSLHAAGLPTGPHELTVQAVDAAGNVSTNGPTGNLGGDSTKTFTVSMAVLSKEPENTVLQFDFTSGIDFNLSAVLSRIKLVEKSTNKPLSYSSQNYIKQGTDWDSSVEKLRRLTLTFTNLSNDTAYTVTADKDITANNGNKLGQDYTWDFSIGNPPAETGAAGPIGGVPTGGEGNVTASGPLTPEQAGTVLKDDGRTVIVLLDAGKLEKVLADSSGSPLAIDLTSMRNGALSLSAGVKVPKELAGKLRSGSRSLVLQEQGLQWRIPPGVLLDSADMTFTVGFPQLTELPAAPDKIAAKGAYQFTIQAGETAVQPEGQTTVSLPIPEGTENARRLTVYKNTGSSTGGWIYAGGRIVDGRLVFSAGGGTGIYLIGESHRTFADISGHWAQETVEIMAARQIADGREADRFDPDSGITRAEFTAMVSRVLKLPYQADGAKFTDVDTRSWYEGYIQAAVKAGIIDGDGDLFRPNDTITRQEMAAIIVRAYIHAGGSVTGGAADFSDQRNISAWAADSVAKAHSLGFIEGRPDGSFGPGETASRAEGLTILLRVMDKLGI